MKNKLDKDNKPFCLKCNSKFVYTLKDGTIVCRNCGHRDEIIVCKNCGFRDGSNQDKYDRDFGDRKNEN